jgi:hypothetical protein
MSLLKTESLKSENGCSALPTTENHFENYRYKDIVIGILQAPILQNLRTRHCQFFFHFSKMDPK